MKIKSAVFAISAPDLKSCPRSDLQEYAFIGRSNVGKSSLINLIAEKKDLAKVSDLPGKTKLINFFTINGNWTLVDLPGYGYAKVAKTDRLEFNSAVRDYLSQRSNLARVFVLIDSRHPPQDMDLQFIHWLSKNNVPFSLVFTKIDKQGVQQSRNVIENFVRVMATATDEKPTIFATSATTKSGRSDLLAFIEKSLTVKKQTKAISLPPMMRGRSGKGPAEADANAE